MEEAPINLEKARYIVDNDSELLDELIRMVIDTYPDQLKKIQHAMQGQETATFRQEIHQLKGSLKNIAADRAVRAASDLELSDITAVPDKAERKFNVLKRELDLLVEYFHNGSLQT